MSYEQKPFLKYKDSPSSSRQPSPSPPAPKKSTSHLLPAVDKVYPKVISYGTVFVLTSAFWMAIVFIFIPSPTDSPSPTASSSAPSTSSKANYRTHNITSDAAYIDCGANRSNEEARQAGCKYDVLMNAWVPAPCYDDEFITEYLDDLSATAYSDVELTKPLKGVEEMVEANGGKYYYTSKRDHVNHCATMWKKQFWVLFEERKEKDSFISNPGHTDHCATFLMEAADMTGVTATKVDVGFAGCWVRS